MDGQRRVVIFSGMVQGVGFRYTACRAAAEYEVTGAVRNLPDGRVECVVEGERGQIEAFLADLRERMRGYIQGEAQRTQAATGEYSRFGVAF